MSMDWFRCYHGAPTDPKWLLIAKRANVRPIHVIGTWWALLDYASQHPDRGSIDGFDAETFALFAGMEEGDVVRILEQLALAGLISARKIKYRWHLTRHSVPVSVAREVAGKCGYRCSYCGDCDGPFEIDHIFPVALGGTDDPDNLTLACAPCNRSKGAKTLEQWNP